jgi:hypothetical protein
MKALEKCKIYLGCSLILSLFLACENHKQSRVLDESFSELSINVNKANQTSSWDATKALKDSRFLKLESKEGLLISGVYKVIVQDDRVYLFDKRLNTIFVYNINGKFLFKIDGPNNGHGDGFQYLMDFAVSQEEEEILAIDYNARKIFVFNSLGEFKKAIKTEYFAKNIFELASGQWIMKNGETESPETPNVVYFLNDDFELTGKSFLKETIKGNSTIGDVSPFFNYRGITKFAYGLGNKIYDVNSEGVKLNSFIDFGGNEIPDDRLENTPLRQLLPEFRSGKNAGLISNYLETDDQIFFSFLQGGNQQIAGRKAMFFSKKENEVKIVTRKIMHPKGFIIPWPQEISDECYVSILTFNDLFENDETVFNDQSRRTSVSKEFGWVEDIEQLLPSVNELDSPILMFYKLDLVND